VFGSPMTKTAACFDNWPGPETNGPGLDVSGPVIEDTAMVVQTSLLLVTLVIGGIAGWLAGLLTRGSGYGLIGDIVVGLLGR
jgi:hypothetical protein